MNSTNSTRRFGLLTLCAILLTALPTFASGPQSFSAFNQVDPNYVLVAAHRGGYMSNGTITHAENSISAMTNSIGLGVDILEIDVRMTSDGGLVAMHDTTVDRTTNGSGSVSSMTLAQVTALQLYGAGGALTAEHVPTLAEVMTLAKGNVLVNLDKVDINDSAIMTPIMQTLQATGTVDHAIFKGGASAAQVASLQVAYPGETIIYMPILSNSNEATTVSTLQAHSPEAIELIFSSSTTSMLSDDSVAAFAAEDSHIWINSLWSSLCAGHHDAVALAGDPDGSWGWLTDSGATIIQTDNAPQLISYLDAQSLRQVPEPATMSLLALGGIAMLKRRKK